MKRARLAVADELVLEREPDLARGDAVLLGNVLKLTTDHTEDSRDDGAFHVLPSRVVDKRGIKKNIVGEVVVLQGEQNLIVPVGVAYKRGI
jgi:hypothetical protein